MGTGKYKKTWKKTFKGLLSYSYGIIKWRNLKFWKMETDFSKKEYDNWYIKHGELLYNKWKLSNFKTGLKPSVDRIDPLKHYTLDNMQIITAVENRRKGDLEKEILWGKKINQIHNGKIIATYKSAVSAAREINGNPKAIQLAARIGQRSAGYHWEYCEDYPKHNTNKFRLNKTTS